MRICAIVAYDGTDFFGWQVQPDKRTVQGVLENALSQLFKTTIKITGSGRTDTGVHAQGQTFSFMVDTTIPPNKIYRAINPLLPPDVKVLSTKKVPDSFNARSSAKKKTYEYNFYLSTVENPLKERYALMVYPTDINKMKQGASLLLGEHDFKAFSATGSSKVTTVRTIYDIRVVKKGQDLTLSITGSGFLYNMVRIIAGSLLAVADGKIPLENISLALTTGDRNLLSKTLPAKALTLKKVSYHV